MEDLIRSHRGFTLIEAVVSVSVFALVIVSIIGVYLAVQRLNQQSAAMQILEQNARFIAEDITKFVRNGQIDYSRYSGSVAPQPYTTDLFLLDRDNVRLHIYKSGTNLILDKSGAGTANFTGSDLRVLDFKAFIWPAADPIPGGSEQPAVTVYMDMETDVNSLAKARFPFQITVATRQYQK